MASDSASLGTPRGVPVLLLVAALAVTATIAAQPSVTPQRIISAVPAVTEILFAVGAGPDVVGIGSFDQLPAGSREITRVGGLLDPDMERIFTLQPDLVILYASQTDPIEQLKRAGIQVLAYEHRGLSDIPSMIRMLGERTGHAQQAVAVATRLETGLADIQARVAGRTRPRTLLVFSREPRTLRNVYASGGVGFLHDMLDIAGGDNVFTDVRDERVAQVSSEAILTASPDVIIEIRNDTMFGAATDEEERAVWQRLTTLPAVRTNNVHFLTGNQFVVPGPRVLEATEQLARVLHPSAF